MGVGIKGLCIVRRALKRNQELRVLVPSRWRKPGGFGGKKNPMCQFLHLEDKNVRLDQGFSTFSCAMDPSGETKDLPQGDGLKCMK